MKKIAIIKKKEVLIGILALFLMAVGFMSYNPNQENQYGKIADVGNYSERLGDATLVSSNSIENEINKIKQDIKNNESDYMKQYGYTIIVDESIVTQTNQFTYTNNRVKNMIINKFGTIKIYARDYYLNGNYMYTEAYII